MPFFRYIYCIRKSVEEDVNVTELNTIKTIIAYSCTSRVMINISVAIINTILLCYLRVHGLIIMVMKAAAIIYINAWRQ